jgi:large subunit ribosomal protein L27
MSYRIILKNFVKFFMAHTKAQGAVKGNRDSRAKRMGVKLYGGQTVQPGNIIVRQKGSKFFAGAGVSTGKDFTLFALESGIINFTKRKGKKVIEVMHG